MIKAVIFDLDDTLYDYVSCNERATEDLCNYACDNYSMDRNTFLDFYERAQKLVKQQLGGVGSAHNRLLYLQRFLEEIGMHPAKGALQMYDVYWDRMLEEMELYPYVIRIMKYLRQNGIIVAVLTDLTAHIQHRKLNKLGLADYVDVLVTSEEAGEDKPSMVVFKLMVEKLGLDGSEMLMIGDSKVKDIDGAAKVGIPGLLFDKQHACDMDKVIMEYIDEQKHSV